jgi:hypothetical protein
VRFSVECRDAGNFGTERFGPLGLPADRLPSVRSPFAGSSSVRFSVTREGGLILSGLRSQAGLLETPHEVRGVLIEATCFATGLLLRLDGDRKHLQLSGALPLCVGLINQTAPHPGDLPARRGPLSVSMPPPAPERPCGAACRGSPSQPLLLNQLQCQHSLSESGTDDAAAEASLE